VNIKDIIERKKEINFVDQFFCSFHNLLNNVFKLPLFIYFLLRHNFLNEGEEGEGQEERRNRSICAGE